MKEIIKVTEYAQMITEALPRGILLNTKNVKFNSMIIGWGSLGTVWGNRLSQYMCGNIAIQKHSLIQWENLQSVFH